MKLLKQLGLLFIILNCSFHSATQAAQTPQPDEELAAQLEELTFEADDDEQEGAIPNDEQKTQTLEEAGYIVCETPAFAQHLARLTKKGHEIGINDIGQALGAISDKELAAHYPTLALSLEDTFQGLLYLMLVSYGSFRKSWITNHGINYYLKASIHWCSPCRHLYEEQRFVLILEQLNNILKTFPEYLGTPAEPLVISEFGEEGCLQTFLLTIGLITVGYRNITLNLFGGPSSELFTYIPKLQEQLKTIKDSVITIIAYLPYEIRKFTLQPNMKLQKPLICRFEKSCEEAPDDCQLAYRYSLQLTKNKSGDEFKAALSHCISMTDGNIHSSIPNWHTKKSIMIAEFCKIARHGAAGKNKALVYTLNDKQIRKYDSAHKNFTCNIAGCQKKHTH